MSAVSKKPTPWSRAARITRSLRASSIRPPKLLQPMPTMGTSIPESPRVRRGRSLIHVSSGVPRVPLSNHGRHFGGPAGTAGHPCYPRSMPDTAAPQEPVVAARPVVVERAVVSVRTLVVAALIVSALLGLAVLLSQVVNLLL